MPDNGVLTLELTVSLRARANIGECTREFAHILWRDQWRRIEEVAPS